MTRVTKITENPDYYLNRLEKNTAAEAQAQGKKATKGGRFSRLLSDKVANIVAALNRIRTFLTKGHMVNKAFTREQLKGELAEMKERVTLWNELKDKEGNQDGPSQNVLRDTNFLIQTDMAKLERVFARLKSTVKKDKIADVESLIQNVRAKVEELVALHQTYQHEKAKHDQPSSTASGRQQPETGEDTSQADESSGEEVFADARDGGTIIGEEEVVKIETQVPPQNPPHVGQGGLADVGDASGGELEDTPRKDPILGTIVEGEEVIEIEAQVPPQKPPHIGKEVLVDAEDASGEELGSEREVEDISDDDLPELVHQVGERFVSEQGYEDLKAAAKRMLPRMRKSTKVQKAKRQEEARIKKIRDALQPHRNQAVQAGIELIAVILQDPRVLEIQQGNPLASKITFISDWKDQFQEEQNPEKCLEALEQLKTVVDELASEIPSASIMQPALKLADLQWFSAGNKLTMSTRSLAEAIKEAEHKIASNKKYVDEVSVAKEKLKQLKAQKAQAIERATEDTLFKDKTILAAQAHKFSLELLADPRIVEYRSVVHLPQKVKEAFVIIDTWSKQAVDQKTLSEKSTKDLLLEVKKMIRAFHTIWENQPTQDLGLFATLFGSRVREIPPELRNILNRIEGKLDRLKDLRIKGLKEQEEQWNAKRKVGAGEVAKKQQEIERKKAELSIGINSYFHRKGLEKYLNEYFAGCNNVLALPDPTKKLEALKEKFKEGNLRFSRGDEEGKKQFVRDLFDPKITEKEIVNWVHTMSYEGVTSIGFVLKNPKAK